MKRRKKLIISCIVLVGFLVFAWVQNNWLEVSEFTYESKEVPQAFAGYRIVQISDLHNASFGKENARLLAKIRELEPNMVVLTGDLVDSSRTNFEVALAFAEKVAADYPTYYVTGNHEIWLEESDRLALLEGLERVGVVCLMNEVVEIEHNGSKISLIGLSDESLSGMTLKNLLAENVSDEDAVPDSHSEEKTADGGAEAGLQILLAHEPQYIENYSKYGVDLVLSGHAHGGQFRLPFVGGGLVAPGQGLFPEYTEGIHVVNDTTMIISRGLGNSVIPVRVFNRPEIVCVELRK